ncbi:MAG TPA: hypothetical protein PKN48_14045 [Bacteroidales bacterium]|nr:hypothetical protein [Bacteroidales bacterium]
MEQELKSEGICIFCNEIISQQHQTKHLAEHLAVVEKEQKNAETGSWHIKVEAGEMFLQLLVDGNVTFKALDKYLRDIWVECCGHMSAFRHRNMKISMKNTLDEVCSPRLKIDYEYDFGDTTYLEVSINKRYAIKTPEKIKLLSRNNPLKLMCAICKKKPAEIICPICMYEENALFCNSCSEIHEKECSDFGEDTQLPVVNSPRMGVCGYGGGIIDKDRDGVYKK